MSAERKIQRRAAREAARKGVREPGKPLMHSLAMRTLEAFAADTDVTRLLRQATPCPYCGVELDTTHSVDETPAEPGNLTVCMKCAGVCQFEEGMTMRAFSDEEVEALPAEARAVMQNLQSMVRHVKLHRAAPPAPVGEA